MDEQPIPKCPATSMPNESEPVNTKEAWKSFREQKLVERPIEHDAEIMIVPPSDEINRVEGELILEAARVNLPAIEPLTEEDREYMRTNYHETIEELVYVKRFWETKFNDPMWTENNPDIIAHMRAILTLANAMLQSVVWLSSGRFNFTTQQEARVQKLRLRLWWHEAQCAAVEERVRKECRRLCRIFMGVTP